MTSYVFNTLAIKDVFVVCSTYYIINTDSNIGIVAALTVLFLMQLVVLTGVLLGHSLENPNLDCPRPCWPITFLSRALIRRSLEIAKYAITPSALAECIPFH